MDHAAWLQNGMNGATDDLQEQYKYFMRVDPEMRDILGPIETVDDELTGRPMRRRLGKVGMTRNPNPDNLIEQWIYLDPLPHIRQVNAKPPQGWYSSKELESPGSRPRPCFTEAILTQPYGGYCTVGCSFCYVNSGFRGYRGSGLVTVPINYGAQMRKHLKKFRTAASGYHSSFTDPFLPLEDYYHNTQQSAEAFVDEGLPVFFLSRLAYPSWAYDILRKSPYSYMQKSLNTPDPEDFKKLSPGALPLLDHFEEIREARRLGIYVSIQCNPVMAGITTHEEIEALIHKLAECGTNHVIVKFVEAGYSWAAAMVERVMKRFGGNRGAAFRDLFIENSCGAQRTIAREYRMEGHQRYRKAATEAGITYASCFEFDKGPDGAWRSIGKDVITAATCHGPRNPMWTRLTPEAPFTEVKDCPPTGCLYCADDNGGKSRCGSDLFGAAKALRAADLKEPVYK